MAKRPLFERRSEVRYFLAQLARQVRIGRIEIHAFCIMTTHFHLLVRSPLGEMSEALRLAQNLYSRDFNRRHKRDGALLGSRFFSKPVNSLIYRRNVVRYIDSNATKARIVVDARLYELGSRAAYARAEGPIWLERDWVEAEACLAAGRDVYSPECYGKAFGTGHSPMVDEFVRARMRSTATEDPLDDLVASTPQRVQRWMRRKARLADGCEIGVPVCGRRGLLAALELDRLERGAWIVEDRGTLRDGQILARLGMLRDLCAWKIDAIGQAEGDSAGRTRRQIDHYRRLLVESPEYAERAAGIAKEAMELCSGVARAEACAVRVGR